MPAAQDNEGYVPLSEFVYRKLRRAIVQGELAQGASVSQTELARRLDVSKTPVRHALTRLVQQGLLVSTPHKGAVVTSLTSGDLEEIYCLRSRLEGLAARTAAERLTDEDAKVLPALLAELRVATAAQDAEAVRRGCVQLHKAIWQASQTRRLPAILTSLQDYAEMVPDTQLDRPSGFEAGLEEHAQVVQAILARDADRAEQAMTRHVAHALDLRRASAGRWPRTPS
ncbi:MAG TPA: GntR family transcriptional regulator [Methylomirabilota bacterium]|jgi:DNA-binding GntR family transcriptional regulator